MARDRKRARQRKARQGRGAAADVRDARPDATRAGVPAGTGGGIPAPSVPAALEHASGEVEEFDAAMARGAAEVFSDDDQDATTALQAGEATNGEVLDAPADTDPGLEDLVDEGPSPSADADADDYEDDDDQDADGSGTAVEAFAQRDEDAPAQRRPRRARAEVSERKLSLPARAAAFLRASWAELQRMQWPDRQQTSQATAVVLGFVVVAGLYLGAADWVAQKVVNLILE